MKRFGHELQSRDCKQEGVIIGENAVLVRSDHERRARWVELRHGKIARLAYSIWQIGREQTGHDQVNWLIAEHIFETGKFTTFGDTETPVIARAG